MVACDWLLPLEVSEVLKSITSKGNRTVCAVVTISGSDNLNVRKGIHTQHLLSLTPHLFPIIGDVLAK